MNELYMDLTFLLGLSYLEENFSILFNDQAFTEVLLSTNCKFFSKIRKMLRKLIKIIDLQYISNILQLSASFLILLKKKSKNSGICLICDKYCVKLEDHLTISHNLSYNYFLNYKNLFSHQTESFFPSVLQRQKPLPIKEDVYIIETKKNPGKIEPKSERILKNIAVNESKVNPFLFYMAEKYVDTIMQKGFFKEKINCNKINKGNKSSDSKKDSQVSGICKICKVPVKEEEWNFHMLSHSKTELVNCPLCNKCFSKRYLARHRKRCLKKIGLSPVSETPIKSSLKEKKPLNTDSVLYYKKTGEKSGKSGFKAKSLFKNHEGSESNLFNRPENIIDISVEEKSNSSSETEDNVLGTYSGTNRQDIEVCEVCNVNVIGDDWRKHMRTHIKNNSNICPICNKSFSVRGYLIKHIKRHDKIRRASKL